ncbi:MAG: protein-L-isoaspartate O-methyltransferase, partial [Zoogloeaceae bacterium]|nr:protein-L-isoaspartate O-methyltransferase [Zoogloeaceae bacterium]
MEQDKARGIMVSRQIRPWGVSDAAVLALPSRVRREDFVPPSQRALAFADMSLPLGDKPCQIMLEPKMEARLLQALAVRPTDKALEIGAGSGYMAALL